MNFFVKRHSDDIFSVEMWMEQFEKLPDNPVSMYEKLENQFMLAIINETQCFILKK